MPLLSIFPAAAAIGVVSCRMVWPLRCYLPKWAKHFVQETEKQPEAPSAAANPPLLSQSTSGLLCLFLIALILQTVAVFYPLLDLMAVPPAVTWAVALLLVLVDRTTTTPFGLLLIIISLFVTQLILLLGSQSLLELRGLPISLELLVALIVVVILVNMPMRDSRLPANEISRSGDTSTSALRSPEDSLTLWQFMTVAWMEPLISLGKSRQLHDEDVWKLGFEFQHRTLHDNFRELKGSVVRRLLAANGLDLIITGFIGIIELGADLSGPVLLQQLLLAMEDPLAPRSNAVTYAVLSLMMRLIDCQASVFSIWFCRRCYERSRGEMITMLYEKTLDRKIIGASTDLEAAQKLKAEEPDAKKQRKGLSYSSLIWNNSLNVARLFFCWRSRKDVKEEARMPASMGKILNLMRNDVYEVSQRFWEFPDFVKDPLGLILSVILVWKLIGWPCFLGVVTVFVAQVINAIITRIVLGWERKRRTATDKKLNKTSEFVIAIRHLRWYGWQESWLTQIMESREQELHLRVIVSLWRICVNFTNHLASGMFPVVAFFAYTKLAGLPLRIDIAFPALQLFSMLESYLRAVPEMITTLLNAKIAVERIEEFMSEPDKENRDAQQDPNTGQLMLHETSFAWPGIDTPVLENISIEFPVGLTVIYGKVAAGKSALLQAILGELDITHGKVDRPDEMIGYCAQTPWLQSMSIKDNILFSYPYDEARYKKVLDACALVPDLDSFKDGDLSNIGENGIGLSGGQKARVALARAMYSRAKFLLLDDPLSALDQQTAETVVQKCFRGPLLEGRTAVLVTHRLDLCHGIATQMIEVTEGKARTLDKTEMPTFKEDLQKVLSTQTTDSASMETAKDQGAVAAPDKFMEDEHRAHGGVQASIYWQYVKAGKLKYWAILVSIVAVFRILTIGRTWFIKSWGEAYSIPAFAQSASRRVSRLFDSLPSPEDNIDPWLLDFLIISLARSALFMVFPVFHGPHRLHSG